MIKLFVLSLLTAMSWSIFWESSSKDSSVNQCSVPPKTLDSYAIDTSDLSVLPNCQEPLYFDPPWDQEIYPSDGILYEKHVEAYRYIICQYEYMLSLNSWFPTKNSRNLQRSSSSSILNSQSINESSTYYYLGGGANIISHSNGSVSGSSGTKIRGSTRLLMYLEEKYQEKKTATEDSEYTKGTNVCSYFNEIKSCNVSNLETDYRRILRTLRAQEIIFGIWSRDLNSLQRYFVRPLTTCNENGSCPKYLDANAENLYQYIPMCASGKNCPINSSESPTKTCATTPMTFNGAQRQTTVPSSKKQGSHTHSHSDSH